MQLKYYKELDGVRGIAALMVIYLHFFQSHSYSGSFINYINKTSMLGQVGVDLFFVLSGFLITRILLKAKSDRNYFSNFYIRRSLRIFPLYYGFLVLVYFIIPLITNSEIPKFSQQIYHWAYLQNFAMTFKWNVEGPPHFWSLAVEEHFYMFWPILLYFLKNKYLKNAIGIVIIISFISRIYIVSQRLEAYYFTFNRIDSLAIGSILSLLELKGYLKKQYARNFFFIALTIMLPTMVLWGFMSGIKNDYIQIVKPILIASFFFCFIGFIVSQNEESKVKSFLRTSFLTYTGKISYGLYVYHPLCFALITPLIKTGIFLIDFSLSITICYLIATISYYGFEVKFLKFKKYFEYNRNFKENEVELTKAGFTNSFVK